MQKTCTFFLHQYVSASSYFVQWETNGVAEEYPPPLPLTSDDSYIRVTASTGQYLFLCQEGPDEGFCMLIEVPSDEGFAAFCEVAEREAGQQVYDRIKGYNASRFGNGPYDYANGFDGAWLRQFSIWSWRAGSHLCPKNLQEALRLQP